MLHIMNILNFIDLYTTCIGKAKKTDVNQNDSYNLMFHLTGTT